MNMLNEIATIKFTDVDTGDEALAVVRSDENHIALGLSLKSDGDIEVVMKKEDAEKLSNVLAKALR
jgi:hypothetical protein